MMICPKCKATYLSGDSCTDCGEKLEEYHEVLEQINEKGIHLIQYGVKLLFLTIFEIIAIVITYDFYWIYKLSHGGVSGTAISNVNPIIWFLVVLESIISFIFIFWGSCFKNTLGD